MREMGINVLPVPVHGMHLDCEILMGEILPDGPPFVTTRPQGYSNNGEEIDLFLFKETSK